MDKGRLNHVVSEANLSQKELSAPVRRYLTAAELAVYIGSTVKTIRSWTSRRKIPAIRKGRFVRYDRVEIDRWMAKDAVKPLPVWDHSD